MSVSHLSFDPNPDGTCRTCRGVLNVETWLCTRCGTAHGERNRCPHCHTVARTLPHPTLLHYCSVCGKPRFLPGSGTLSTTDEATMHLGRAGQSQRIGTMLKMLSYVMLGLGLPGLLLTAVVLLILMPGTWVSGIALFFALVPLLLGLFLRQRSQASLLARESALDLAYSQAILGALRASTTERAAAEIAQAIGLSVAQTERLLTHLNADERMTSRVTDDGELVFGMVEPTRLRVADSDGIDAASSTVPADIVEAELDEANPVVRPLSHRT